MRRLWIAFFTLVSFSATGMGAASCAEIIAEVETSTVKTREQAVSIAEPILKSAYGADAIDRQKPLVAKQNGDVWVVRGTLPIGMKGGVAEVQLCARTGKVIKVLHGE
jgi:hypothetical protein